MINLKHDTDTWSGLSGALAFGDGTEPFFADLTLHVNVSADGLSFGKDGILCLSMDNQSWSPQLTLNMTGPEGEPAWFRKVFQGYSWQEALAWAHRHLDEVMAARELKTLGFEFFH